MPKPAIAYIRVSTKDQGEHGNGLDLQLVRINAYAKEAGYRITDTFRDVHTGVGPKSISGRPGVRDAFHTAVRTGRPIIVDGLDRIHRDTRKLEELVLDRLGGKLRIISAKSGEGAARAVIMGEAARAQEEAERISASTREGLKRALQRGAKLGNPKNLAEAQAKGSASNKARAERQADELGPVIRQIRESGVCTKEAIAKELNRRGYLTARSERWNKDNVRRLLSRLDLPKPADEKLSQHNYWDDPNWGVF